MSGIESMSEKTFSAAAAARVNDVTRPWRLWYALFIMFPADMEECESDTFDNKMAQVRTVELELDQATDCEVLTAFEHNKATVPSVPTLC